MKKIMKFLKDKNLVLDAFNIMLSILLLVCIILVCTNPSNPLLLLAVIMLGGAMNLINGLKQFKSSNKAKKNMGMSMIMLGMIIMVLGIFFVLPLY